MRSFEAAHRRLWRWWWRTHWIRALWRVRLVAMAVGLLLAVAALELVWRAPGVPLPRGLESALFQCYASEYDDENVGFFSPQLSITLLRPNVDRHCAWNGYRWHHHGDRYGYRNPKTWNRADVVLLGDSMTYGHGVEESSTAAHFLRKETGKIVVNLGWMGDSPVEYLARLRNFALPLHPHVVVVDFFQNDLDDVLKARTPTALQSFIDDGDGSEAAVFPRETLEGVFHPRVEDALSAIGEHCLTCRTLRYFLRASSYHPEMPDESSVPVPALEEQVELQGAEALAVEYLEASAKAMAAAAHEAGAHLVFTNLPAVDAGRRLQLVRQRVHAVAEAQGIPFLDLVGKLAVDGRLDRGDYFLAHDGHLSEAGHRRVAHEIADFLRERHLLDAP